MKTKTDPCLECGHDAQKAHDRLGRCSEPVKVPVPVDSPLYADSKPIAPTALARYRVEVCACPGLRL